MDMRILPSVGAAAVLTEIDALCRDVEDEYGVTIDYEIIQRVESKPTDEDAQLVRAMKNVVKNIYQVQARPVGIGGGTVGAYLRNEGLDTVVWGKLDESAHMPNEYCIIDNLVGDAKVMALLALEY
jgi:succinyl-diaminopimelate desuccinylase